jgi:hypothetical protein
MQRAEESAHLPRLIRTWGEAAMKSLRLLIAIPMAVVWLVVTRGVCEARSEADLAKASQNPVANTYSFPLQLLQRRRPRVENLLSPQRPARVAAADKQWLFVSRSSLLFPIVKT